MIGNKGGLGVQLMREHLGNEGEGLWNTSRGEVEMKSKG